MRGKASKSEAPSLREIEKNEEEKFMEGLEYLQEEYPYLVTDVLNIGSPIWDNSCPTAAISAEDGNVHDLSFLFNPDFIKQFDNKKIGFIIAHETLHVVLNHLPLSLKFPDKKLFNISCDAIINDYLARNGMQMPDWVVRGSKLIGEDCSDKSVDEVYNQILNESSQGGSGEEGNSSQGQDDEDGSGNSKQEEYGDYTDASPVDSHEWIHNPSQEMQEKVSGASQKAEGSLPEDLEDLKEESPQVGRFQTSSQPGSGDSQAEEWRVNNKVSLKWEELLKEIDPTIFEEPGELSPPARPAWHRQPRALAGFPGTRLPVMNRPEEEDKDKGEKAKPFIVMALDTSGSIGDETARDFIKLAKSIPEDKVEVRACTFTERYRKLDLKNPRFSSGGTNFDAISKFISQEVVPEMKKDPKIKDNYPQAILVVTDGEARFSPNYRPKGENCQKWTWLTVGSSYYAKHYIAALPGKIKKLRDFVK